MTHRNARKKRENNKQANGNKILLLIVAPPFLWIGSDLGFCWTQRYLKPRSAVNNKATHLSCNPERRFQSVAKEAILRAVDGYHELQVEAFSLGVLR